MATIFRTYCTNALKVLGAQFETSAALTHGSSLGAIREQMIRDFLKDHLPELVTIVSGQIFDTRDSRSSQQDVVLVLKSVPRLPFATGVDLIYAEGVVATVEVKSALSAPVLKEVCESISTVRSLKPEVWGSSAFNVSHSWPNTRILNIVLTYGGSSLSSLESVADSVDDLDRPDIILDLSKGSLVRNHGLLLPQEGTTSYLTIPDPANALMLFLILLTEITGTLGSRGVNWRAYMDAGQRDT